MKKRILLAALAVIVLSAALVTGIYLGRRNTVRLSGEAESDFNEGGEIKGYTFTVNIDKDAAEMAIHANGLQIWSRGEEVSNHYISWGETEYFVPKEYITGILRTPVRSTGEDVRLALSAPGVSCPTPIAWSWENYESAAVIPLLDRGGVKIAPLEEIPLIAVCYSEDGKLSPDGLDIGQDTDFAALSEDFDFVIVCYMEFADSYDKLSNEI